MTLWDRLARGLPARARRPATCSRRTRLPASRCRRCRSRTGSGSGFDPPVVIAATCRRPPPSETPRPGMVLAVTGYVWERGRRRGLRPRAGPDHRRRTRGADVEPVAGAAPRRNQLKRDMADDRSGPPPRRSSSTRRTRRPRSRRSRFNRPEHLNAPTSRRGCATPTCCTRPTSTTTSRSGDPRRRRQPRQRRGPARVHGGATTTTACAARARGSRTTTSPTRRRASFRHGATISAVVRRTSQAAAGRCRSSRRSASSRSRATATAGTSTRRRRRPGDLVRRRAVRPPVLPLLRLGPADVAWAQMMGLRKFQEMVFTGRPFTADEMYECDFVNKRGAARPARGRGREVRAGLRAQPARPTPSSCRRCSSRSMKQHQGEYMGSLLSARVFESMGSGVRPTTTPTTWTCTETHRQRAGRRGQGQRQPVPARVAAEQVRTARSTE